MSAFEEIMSQPEPAEPTDLERECDAVDALLRHLGLDPERCRTEGGALKVARAKSLLADRVGVDEMVSRFLGWKLPADFFPDAGITFKPRYNEHMPWGGNTHEPTGTNLLTADQARGMLEYVIGVAAPTVAEPIGWLCRTKQQVIDAEKVFPGEPHDYLWKYTHGTKDMERFAAFPDLDVVPVFAATPPRAALTDAEWCAEWLLNHYQDHLNVASLCEHMLEAAHGIGGLRNE